MATIQTYNVFSGAGNSGRDWDTLPGAIAQAVSDYPDLVSADVQLVFECGEMTDTSGPMTVSGFTVDATRNIIIRGTTPPGVTSGGFRYVGSAGTLLMTIGEWYTVVENIYVENTNTTRNDRTIGVSTSRFVTYDGVIAKAASSLSGSSAIYAVVPHQTIRNCIAIGGNYAVAINDGDDTTVQNTLAIGGTIGYWARNNAIRLTMQNCAAINNTTNYSLEPTAISTATLLSNNAGESGDSIPGMSPVTITEGAFVDYANNDFRAATGSALDGAGADLSGTFTDDIGNTVRTAPWSIGPYIVGGTPAPLITNDPETIVRGGAAYGLSGVNFGATQGAGSVTIGGEALTVTAWSDSSVTFSVPSNIALQHGDYTITLTTDSGGSDSTDTVVLNPTPGRAYKDISDPTAGVFNDPASIFEGDTELGITGAQYVYDQITNSGVGVEEIDNAGYVTFSALPPENDWFEGYKISADGTIGSTFRFTTTGAASSAVSGTATSPVGSTFTVAGTGTVTMPSNDVRGIRVALFEGATAKPATSNIHALWWDTPNPAGAPVFETTTASINGSGELELDLESSTSLAIGDSGFLLLWSPDEGTPEQSEAFSGRVEVLSIV